MESVACCLVKDMMPIKVVQTKIIKQDYMIFKLKSANTWYIVS